jgi:hypothetical protein
MHCSTLAFITKHCFSYIAITPYIAIVGDLAPQVDLLSSIKDDTFDTYSIPLKVETRWLASKSLEKLVVEPKTLGWENSQKSFENGFENLGVVSTPLKCFLNDFGTNGTWGMEERSWWFWKKALVFLCSRSKQLTRATTLPRYGTGPSLKSVCFSAGSLTTI